MDPKVVLGWITTVRTFVEQYGGLLFGYVRRAVEFLIWVLMHLPGWITDAWHFLSGLIDVIRAYLGW